MEDLIKRIYGYPVTNLKDICFIYGYFLDFLRERHGGSSENLKKLMMEYPQVFQAEINLLEISRRLEELK